jgi:DNA repair protein RadC
MRQPAVPSTDRPRERLWTHGPAALTAVELVAILIGTGRVGESATGLAAALLERNQGSLRRMATRAPSELLSIRGIGRAKASRLAAALELGNRLVREARPLPLKVRSPADVVGLVGGRLRDLEVEEFHMLAVNRQGDVTRDVLITRGLLDAALVHPREVFRAAITEAAASVILVHNHPSGDPTPSPEDLAITRQLVAAGQLLDMPVQDHLIVAGDRFVSFAAQGLL